MPMFDLVIPGRLAGSVRFGIYLIELTQNKVWFTSAFG